MVTLGTILAISLLALGVSVVAVAHSYATRDRSWPNRALRAVNETNDRQEVMEQAWRTFKLGIDEQLEAMSDVHERIETKRRRVSSSEARQNSQAPPAPVLSPAQHANLLWRQHKGQA